MRHNSSVIAALMAYAMIGHSQGMKGYDSQNERELPSKKLDVPPSFRENTDMHEFVIKGIKISARNKKMAEKIYRNKYSKH